MGGLPDPLDKNRIGVRILSDAGIVEAMREKVIQFFPAIEPDNQRIQPVSIDRTIACITEASPFDEGLFGSDDFEYERESTTLPARMISVVRFADRLRWRIPGAFRPFNEGSSSIRRHGPSIANKGAMYSMMPEGDETEVLNPTYNPILDIHTDKSLQTLFEILPFYDELDNIFGPSMWEAHLDPTVRKQQGEWVRSLGMGVQTSSEEDLEALVKAGHLKVTPELKTINGHLVVHASDRAYRMRILPEGIDYAKRRELKREDLLEPIDISKGYMIKPYEHIIVETMESFELSPHVAILFKDNPNMALWDYPRTHMEDMQGFFTNLAFSWLSDGLVDPGYVGGFSRMPKTLSHTGRYIRPGDPIGIAIVIHIPKGVNRWYGHSALSNQYQHQKETKLAGTRA